MATIASLAVRLTANIDQFEKNFKTVSTMVESLAKKTAAARPSVKSLMDAAEGYANVMQSASRAEQMLKDTSENCPPPSRDLVVASNFSSL